MDKELSEKELLEIEKQLNHPDGEFGLEIGENMNQTNSGMIINSIEYLELKHKNLVLELGHGNCGHLPKLLDFANEIQYHGLEVSATMWQAAVELNSHFNADFRLYDGQKIPYDSNTFDRVVSVNTVYFWQRPKTLLQEIHRVLKPDGICVLTYGEKSFMEKLPFVRDRFKLYDKDEIEQLVSGTDLTLIAMKNLTEQVDTKTGEQVTRYYTMTKMRKD